MTRAKVIALATMLALAVSTAPAVAQSVRGRVVFPNGAPMSGAGVRICNQTQQCSGFAITGPDGMYYLYGIPGGPALLEIHVGQQGPQRVYQIVVYPGWTDIPPASIY